MLTAFAASPLNHILRNESWANKWLQSYAGKTVRICIPPFVNIKLLVQANGELDQCSDHLEADTTLSILPAILPRLIAHDESAYDAIDISGDAMFAEDLITIGKHLKPNFEQELGKILGDIPAHRLAQAGEHFIQWHINTFKNLSDALGEYWLEEQPIIAKQNAIKRSLKEIDALQHDTDQLELRIHRIIQKRTTEDR